MHKRLFVMLALVTILCSSVLIREGAADLLNSPAKVKLYVGPLSFPADNSASNCVFVQLQDVNGKPARALQDTIISLSSSATKVGTVDSSVTIRKGETCASANFYSSYTPGTTTIVAAASGYTTVQAAITTFGPIPSTIAVYGFPSTLPADCGSYDTIMVQLQDSSGSPAKAPNEGLQVMLSCSNTAVGTINPLVTIQAGKTYAVATFTTTTTTGQAIITPMAQGYTSKQITIKTQVKAISPSKIQIQSGSTKVLADKTSYRQVAIQLQNSAGTIASAPMDMVVTITSSNEGVGTVESQITVPQSATYAVATLTTTYKPGTTTLTAAASDCVADTETVSTVGFVPSKLVVYCVPSMLPSDNIKYQAIKVQLQDSQGRPAPDPEKEVKVNLFSSEAKIGSIESTLTIPFGKTEATGAFTVTNAPGSTTITAQASDYTAGQAKITTCVIDFASLNVRLTANPESVSNGNKTKITAYLTVDGNPITGAKVKFTSDNGGVFSTVEEQEGNYRTTFTAPSFTKPTVCTITASASKSGYIDSQATLEITVGLASISNNTASNSTSGMLLLCIKDYNENPVGDASISSTTQPAGVKSLSGFTNATGYVRFNNVTAGMYTFTVVKEGYEEMTQTINFKGQPMTRTFLLSPVPDNTPLILFAVVIVLVIAVISGVVIIKRRKSASM